MVADSATRVSGLRPRYESANIRTWIGFKQFVNLATESVLEWFRERGHGPQRLYHDYGLGLEIVDSSVLLPAVLEVDDVVVADVSRSGDQFAVRLGVRIGEHETKVLRGKVTVALVERERPDAAVEVPPDLLPLVTSSVSTTLASFDAPLDRDVFSWDWHTRYFHCHYSDRVQHSAYVQALEEVVDRYLANCGISVPRMLAERGWIPVVSRARVRVVGDAFMDQTVRTTFSVTDVFASRAFDGRMDCYVLDGDRRRHVATATILHGYAVSKGAEAGALAELDENTVQTLLTGGAR